MKVDFLYDIVSILKNIIKNHDIKTRLIITLIMEVIYHLYIISRKVGDISAIMLSKNLQELEKDGIVMRKQFDEIPPHVEYSLSKLGQNLTPALESLGKWGTEVYHYQTQQ